MDLADVQILGRAGVLLEVERLHVADRARDLVEQHIARVPRGWTFDPSGASLQRPDRVGRSGQQAKAAKLQEIAPGRKQFAYRRVCS